MLADFVVLVDGHQFLVTPHGRGTRLNGFPGNSFPNFFVIVIDFQWTEAKLTDVNRFLWEILFTFFTTQSFDVPHLACSFKSNLKN